MKPISPIHVIGIGLNGVSGLSDSSRIIVEQSTLLVGSIRHLSYFPDYAGERLQLGNLSQAIAHIRQFVTHSDTPFAPQVAAQPSDQFLNPDSTVAVLTSGDPLFFGLGRLLLMEFPADWLTFHPHLSSIQLAFSRVKLPWQDAQIISAHGRSLDELTQALCQGSEKIAVLTDDTHSPGAIAGLLAALDLPYSYQMWVCENLGGTDEKIHQVQDFAALTQQTFAPLNVVVLQRQAEQTVVLTQPLPMVGIQDRDFLSFRDRPGLMTKREIRILVLGELALQPQQTIWDIGAGTGSVSIEIARLCPTSQVFSVEKTAAGIALLQQNCQRFQVENITAICGAAPEALKDLPTPDRVFIGGSGGNLSSILDVCADRLALDGRLVLALATLEHLNTALTWFAQTRDFQWTKHLLQIQISRSVPVAALTRMAPLNPVTLVIFERTGISKKRLEA